MQLDPVGNRLHRRIVVGRLAISAVIGTLMTMIILRRTDLSELTSYTIIAFVTVVCMMYLIFTILAFLARK